MSRRNRTSVALLAILGMALAIGAVPRLAEGAPQVSYEDLLELFRQFRDFQQPATEAGVPDYSAAAMAEQFDELRGFQRRLAGIDSSGWPIDEQVDYHLVRAEMNGLEFRHRVLAPWSLDPGFYNDVLPRLGRNLDLPLDGSRTTALQTRLQAVRGVVEQAKVNLSDLSRVAGDLGTLAVLSLADTRESYERLVTDLAERQPDLVEDAHDALAAIDDYVAWIESNKRFMTARAGVGVENYNWLMKNVYLFPYTWDEIRTIVELEDNRVRTFQRLEENRNRNVPPIEPVQSQAEYQASVAEAIEHLMNFLVEDEIFTVDDYLTPDDYFGSWHGFENPWPETHDYFFNFSHREPLMEETHEMVGHHFDGLRSRNDTREIRGGRRPYKIGTARGEGFAFALEELLMHAGYLDGRNPHGREIAYEQAAFRTVRALADIYMHSGDWSYDDAYRFAVENAPHGELLDGSHHLWFELDTTLRGVGHHMLMVVGKVQFMKLMRDRSNQLGDAFVLGEFLDEVLNTGSIPWSLIRWEMTGLDDEIRELTAQDRNLEPFPLVETGARVVSPPDGVHSFYTKYINADGVVIVSSDAVPDAALTAAYRTIVHLTGRRPDVLRAMLPHHPRISIMGLSETASDLPEFGPRSDGEWGLGQMPDSSTSLVSVRGVCYAGNTEYRANFLLHEFVHAMQNLGWATTDPEVEDEIWAAYVNAVQRGQFKAPRSEPLEGITPFDAYGDDEYLTHNINAWFDLNESLPGPWVDVQIGDSGPPSGTRAELRARDPRLFEIVGRFLPASLGDLMVGCGAAAPPYDPSSRLR